MLGVVKDGIHRPFFREAPEIHHHYVVSYLGDHS